MLKVCKLDFINFGLDFGKNCCIIKIVVKEIKVVVSIGKSFLQEVVFRKLVSIGLIINFRFVEVVILLKLVLWLVLLDMFDR